MTTTAILNALPNPFLGVHLPAKPKRKSKFQKLFTERAADKCGSPCGAGDLEGCSCRDWARKRSK